MPRLSFVLAAVLLVLSGAGCGGRQLFPDPDCPQVLRQVSSGVPPTDVTKIRHEIEVLQTLTPGPALAHLTSHAVTDLRILASPGQAGVQVALVSCSVYSGAILKYCGS